MEGASGRRALRPVDDELPEGNRSVAFCVCSDTEADVTGRRRIGIRERRDDARVHLEHESHVRIRLLEAVETQPAVLALGEAEVRASPLVRN